MSTVGCTPSNSDRLPIQQNWGCPHAGERGPRHPLPLRRPSASVATFLPLWRPSCHRPSRPPQTTGKPRYSTAVCEVNGIWQHWGKVTSGGRISAVTSVLGGDGSSNPDLRTQQWGFSMRIFDQEFGKVKLVSDDEANPSHRSASALDDADPGTSPSAIATSAHGSITERELMFVQVSTDFVCSYIALPAVSCPVESDFFGSSEFDPPPLVEFHH
jgi:hypothetical protein